jgi:acylphosphatase
MAKELRLIRIHGKVQGVGYRFFATRVARRLGLKGSIQNQRDGTVEAIVEGDKKVIDEWIEELKEGPRYAEVTHIDQETKEFTGRLGDFDVKF